MSSSSRLRGDDDVLSLMDQMSAAQGYESLAAPSKEAASSINNNNNEHTARVRLTPEITGYPCDQTVGSSMIWNPYTQVSAPSANPKCMFPPTNPQVEVFRRRAFERFKSEFRTSLERIHVNATAKVGASNLWGELSPVSMMERWHFDAKLEEFLNCDNDEATRDSIFNGTLTFTTCQVKTAMDNGGTVDPILISTDKKRRKRKRGDQTNDSSSTPRPPSFRSPSSLLADEVKFEWTRTWKRIGGDKYKETDLKQIFESKKVKKKLSRFTRSVMEAASEVTASFYDQVSKRAALEAQLMGRPSKKSSIPKIIMEDEDVYVKFTGLSFKLNLEHYRKLEILFDRMHPNSTDRATHESAFASSLFCLLCRYDMLQGAGLQSSMHGSVFDVLLQHYDCRLECFASPLNSRYERFCSAFYDTDAAFGSVGSFFAYDFSIGGCYQANPPFATNFIKSMYDTMHRALETCEEPLMFVVFVPAWKETPGWNLLNESSYLTKHVSLAQSSHYYCEGTQHRRKDRYRVASFDTSVFILQNKAAETKWSIAESQMNDLKAAFSRDPSEGSEEKLELVAATVAEHRKKGSTSGSNEQVKEEEAASKSTKKRKKKDKPSRKLLVEGEEGAQQLDILDSLGISGRRASESDSKKTKKKKKRKQK